VCGAFDTSAKNPEDFAMHGLLRIASFAMHGGVECGPGPGTSLTAIILHAHHGLQAEPYRIPLPHLLCSGCSLEYETASFRTTNHVLLRPSNPLSATISFAFRAMEPPAAYLALPPELVTIIFDACLTLRDLVSFAGCCKHFRNTFLHRPGHYDDRFLRPSLPAFEDALRAQRASVSAMLHLQRLGYGDGDEDFQTILPPTGAPLGPIPPVCRFDLEEGDYVNVPTKEDIIKLGETPIATIWEAQQVIQRHKIISSCRRSINFPSGGPDLGVWFGGFEPHGPWTSDQEERFFRGAYRLWLYGYLFIPGCYLEPFIVEKERMLELADDDGRFGFRDSSRTGVFEQYPLYIPVIDSDVREERLEFLFAGFLAWLVHDGEQRGLNEHARGIPSTQYYTDTKARDVHPAAAHGGMRELLLIHTMMTFLGDMSSRPERKLGIVSSKSRVL
jgi:hypothetical protein